MPKYSGFIFFCLAIIPFVAFLTLSEWVNKQMGLPEDAAGPLGWVAMISAGVFIIWVVIYTLRSLEIIKPKSPSKPNS